MKTAPNQKNLRTDSKKRFTVEMKNQQTGMPEVSLEERHQLIAEAAYFLAERRSFAPGHELEDWLRAEAEIETKLVKISLPIEDPIDVNAGFRRH